MTKTKKNQNTHAIHHVSKRMREGVLILACAAALFFILSFITFHSSDPSWSSTGTTMHVLNLGGRVGAWVSDVFLYVFGFCAYLFPISIVYGAWLLCFRYDDSIGFHWGFFGLRFFGFLLALISAAALLQAHLIAGQNYLPMGTGGVLGYVASNGLSQFLNPAGATLMLAALFLAGITLLTGLSWFGVFDVLGRITIRFGFFLVMNGKRLFQWYRAREPKEKEKPRAHKEPILNDDEEETEEEDELPIKKPIFKKQTPLVREPAKRVPVPLPSFNKQMGLPSLDLLNESEETGEQGFSKEELTHMSQEVEKRLKDFGIDAEVVAIHPGPVITRFELELAAGIKVSKITGLAKDLARSLSVVSVRVVEVIPGKSVIGLEVPNAHREIVTLREVLSSAQYQRAPSALTLALGKDIAGHPFVVDLQKMPHLLVAGTTGSGKSVALNAMILSVLYKVTPEHVRFIMIDPKMLELSIYEGIPHLLTPVVTNMKEAGNALRWCVSEMDRRYRLMSHLGVRHLAGYNQKVEEAKAKGKPILDPLFQSPAGSAPVYLEPLPWIVVLIDEYADMMMVVGKKVEELIARIAQKARAAGIHLILATQRPSVDVITGLIKANIPTRIAFQVSQRVDSRTIIDQQGAEHLLGYGDMLYLPPGSGIPVRVHGAFVSDDEVHKVVSDWKSRGEPRYLLDITEDPVETDEDIETSDPLYDEAVNIVVESQRASISYVQRHLKIGYNRSARLLEEMERRNIVSAMESNGSREVLVAPPPKDHG